MKPAALRLSLCTAAALLLASCASVRHMPPGEEAPGAIPQSAAQ